MERVEQGGYSPDFLARAVVWWRLSNQVRLHSEDAVNRAAAKKQRGKRG